MYKLRPYQQEAVDRVLNFFRHSREPSLVVLPTGAGKSLVIAELSHIAKGRVLVLAHVKELVEQNHQKFESYGEKAGIFSAGLGKKERNEKVIFGSIQSITRAEEDFFKGFTLVIIDECHRVDSDADTQYGSVLKKLKQSNPHICILGLTATPYRLGLGWIYRYNLNGEIKTEGERFFKYCLYELSIDYMIKNKYLTRPIKIDIPVTSYDFSDLTLKNGLYSTREVENILKEQKRLTPLIIKNIIDITEKYERQGVMIFSSTINHAKEILNYLPQDEAKLIIGDTQTTERDEIINSFKEKKFKYLVNVSVLTTGFDAPHVDVIAILRPTESVSLYQQIIGRGLRLSQGKEDCFILDYTGMGHDIYRPEVSDKKPSPESVPVEVICPKCDFINHFWGVLTEDGEIIEHYGRKCRGATTNPKTMEPSPCGYRFRYKICPACASENDITARECEKCKQILIDADSKLKQAKLSKDAHILKPDSSEVLERVDKNGVTFLEIKYYDYDAQSLSEYHYLNNPTAIKKFNINFLRSHLKRPEEKIQIKNVHDVIGLQKRLRLPQFIIARKQGKYWKITEKIFTEEL